MHIISLNNSSIEKPEAILETKTCPLCKQYNTIIMDSNSTDIVCSKCGIVLSDKIDTRQEWHSIDRCEIHAKTSTGPPLSLARHDMGLSTIIGKENTDANKKRINITVLPTIQRLRTWNSRALSRNNTIIAAYSKLYILKDQLGLSESIAQTAAYIFRKAQKRRMVLGRSSITVLTASIYLACRQLGALRKLKDICAASNIESKSIIKYYKKLVDGLRLEIPTMDKRIPIVRLANDIKVSEKTKYKALTLMNKLEKHGIFTGKKPMAVAAAVLSISCRINGEQRNLSDIADTAQISLVTVEKRIRDIVNRLELHDYSR